MKMENSTLNPEISALVTRSPTNSSLNYEQMIIITVFIAVFGLWSTVGNLITILAVTTRRNMRTKTNMFILSLAISDTLSSAVASPLWLYRRTWGFYSWELGQFGCKLYWFVDESTSYCTAMHIAAFAIWRFILIKWPHRMATIKRRSIIICICVIWTLSIIFGGFIFSSYAAALDKTLYGGVVTTLPMCSLDFRNNGVARFKTYYTFSTTTFLLFPMAVLVVVSVLIAMQLLLNKQFKSNTRRVKEKRAVAQLAMIATSFAIGYIPMTTYINWTIRATNKDSRVDYWFGVAAYLCLRFSECLNPIAYNVASNKMRKSSKQVLFSAWTCCGKCRPMPKISSTFSTSAAIETGQEIPKPPPTSTDETWKT